MNITECFTYFLPCLVSRGIFLLTKVRTLFFSYRIFLRNTIHLRTAVSNKTSQPAHQQILHFVAVTDSPENFYSVLSAERSGCRYPGENVKGPGDAGDGLLIRKEPGAVVTTR